MKEQIELTQSKPPTDCNILLCASHLRQTHHWANVPYLFNLYFAILQTNIFASDKQNSQDFGKWLFRFPILSKIAQGSRTSYELYTVSFFLL